jgi:hypothetical protein
MEAAARVAARRDIHDAAQLAAVLRRERPGDHVDRFDLGVRQLGRECGRAVVLHRHAVDDDERLVLGAARMQHAVRFDEPSGLQVDDVEELAARDRRLLLAELLRADAVRHTGPMRVDQGGLFLHVHRCRKGRHVQNEADLTRPRGADFDELAARREARARQRQPIGAERQPIEDEGSAGIGVERPVGLRAVAREGAAGHQAEPGRVDHRHAQHAGRELRADRHGRKTKPGRHCPQQRAPSVTS